MPGLGSEGEGQEGIQRQIRGSEVGKSRGEGASTPPHLRRREVVVSHPGGLRALLEQHTGCGGGARQGRESARGLWFDRRTLSS